MFQLNSTKRIVFASIIFVMAVSSWALTMWLSNAKSTTPYFFKILGLSGPSLFYFMSHGSTMLWVFGLVLVCVPLLLAIYKNKNFWRYAWWSAFIWTAECFFLGSSFLFFM